jgi:hypothetical protein
MGRRHNAGSGHPSPGFARHRGTRPIQAEHVHARVPLVGRSACQGEPVSRHSSCETKLPLYQRNEFLQQQKSRRASSCIRVARLTVPLPSWAITPWETVRIEAVRVAVVRGLSRRSAHDRRGSLPALASLHHLRLGATAARATAAVGAAARCPGISIHSYRGRMRTAATTRSGRSAG